MWKLVLDLRNKSAHCRKISISNNVGSVKYGFEHTSVCTHRRAPFRSRRWFARFQPGLALNRQGQELGPTQPSLRSLTAIKIPFIRTPLNNRERDAQSLRR